MAGSSGGAVEPATPGPARRDGERPLVSVIIPAYNGARTLPQMLERVRAQDYQPVERILVDDGSADGTFDIATRFAAADPAHTQIVHHSENWGLSRSLNDALARTRGSYVLIVHQDIELVGDDWIRRAVGHLESDPTVAVVTAYYGVPATSELNFAMRAFGFIRQQFHTVEPTGEETVTFSEFKCDLFRRQPVADQENFPTRFRIAGEDILLSFRLRRAGFRLLKCYDLVAIQRFTGHAENIRGNLYKDYRFGMAITGTLRAFGTYAFRQLDTSRYARSRSLHRASQPVFSLALLVLLVVPLLVRFPLLWLAAPLLVVARWAYYLHRLAPEYRPSDAARRRGLIELAAAAAIGVVSDLAYSAGVLVGALRSAAGASL